jgi:glycosyltransferase involved in cell wall biosynthesis
MAKKIAFGCTLLNRGINESGIDGIGHYCQELLHHLEKETSGFAMQRYSFGEPGGNHEISLYPKYPIHLIRGFLSLPTKSSTPQDAFQSADLIHSTDHLVPTGIKKPLLASIMDVIPLSNPEFIRSNLVLAKASLWKKLSQRADHIITISEFSKQEIAKHMGYPPDQITTIPLGIDQRYFDRIEKNEIERVKIKYSIDRPFFLFIGSLQPRKNLVRILEAHQKLPGNLSKEFPIVVVGREFWDDGTIMIAIQKGIHDKRCIWLDYVSDFEKRCLLQSTLVLCFASLYEGFGLPILEAFASKAPVITSNLTSMPEVAKGGAILVDPLNISELTSAMANIILNDSDRVELSHAGLTQARAYSWEQSAKKTCEVYTRLT